MGREVVYVAVCTHVHGCNGQGVLLYGCLPYSLEAVPGIESETNNSL